MDADVGFAEGEAVGGDPSQPMEVGVEGEGFEGVEAGVFGHGAPARWMGMVRVPWMVVPSGSDLLASCWSVLLIE